MPRKRKLEETLPPHIKVEKFLFRNSKRPMIHGYFINFRSVGNDAKVVGLSSKLQQETGRDDGMLMLYYCTRMVYTEHLEFDWHPDAPSYYTSLEEFWEMRNQGASDAELYLFYIENIHNVIGNEWNEALESATRIWKPPAENWDDEVEGEEVDPNE